MYNLFRKEKEPEIKNSCLFLTGYAARSSGTVFPFSNAIKRLRRFLSL